MDDTDRHSALVIQYSIFKTWTFNALIDLDPDVDSKTKDPLPDADDWTDVEDKHEHLAEKWE